MRLSILLLSFVIISCGNKQESNYESNTRIFNSSDSTFNQLKHDFTLLSENKNLNIDLSDLPINFGDIDKIKKEHSQMANQIKNSHFMTDSNPVGVCIQYDNGQKEIIIRESAWNSYSSVKQEILIFHELGHCALNREHDEEKYKGFKLSLMHPNLLNQIDYNDLYYDYLDEFFSRNKDKLKEQIDSI